MLLDRNHPPSSVHSLAGSRIARTTLRRLVVAAGTFTLLGASSAVAASLTGVCPDGSMFIVKRADLIPCAEAKLVEPNDMPPLRPQYLPRPYGWERFEREKSPNNPYNLVRTKPTLPSVSSEPPSNGGGARGEAPPVMPAPTGAESRTGAGGEHLAARQPFRSEPSSDPDGPIDLALTSGELSDLALIVELSQQRAPASIAATDAAARVRLARSSAFERRFRSRTAGQARGPVVLFTAEAQESVAFHGNLTFVQGHVAYTPRAEDPLELGVLQGKLGSLAAGEALVGYVVLPERLDLHEPMDIYWNDRQITATLMP